MTETIVPSPSGVGAALVSALRGTGRAMYESYRLGGRTIVTAPLILAIAIVPEFAQHVVEIALGMFASTVDFRAHAEDPLRMGFGYAKIAGFVIAILLTARFWALGTVRGALHIRPAALARLVFAIGLTAAISVTFDWAGRQMPSGKIVLTSLSFLVQTGFTFYVVAALLDDTTMTLRRAFTGGWPSAIVMTILLVAAFGPALALHMANHKLVIGQAAPVVWMVMAFDALFIGLFAALVGSALYVGYRCGASWRGWASDQPG